MIAVVEVDVIGLIGKKMTLLAIIFDGLAIINITGSFECIMCKRNRNNLIFFTDPTV